MRLAVDSRRGSMSDNYLTNIIKGEYYDIRREQTQGSNG